MLVMISLLGHPKFLKLPCKLRGEDNRYHFKRSIHKRHVVHSACFTSINNPSSINTHTSLMLTNMKKI
jgi:hypothetical protein